jgi:tRNA threonylcarbamoyladenosine biosynthesis protein TsaE
MRVTWSASEDETRALAAALASELAPGDVVLLEGPLGAGKTLFAQALGRALGVRQPMTSPSYALVHRYELPDGGRLVHVDLYRLGDEVEVEALGLWDDVAQGAIVLVEWPDRSPSLTAEARVRVHLEDAGPTSRRVLISDGP